MAPPVLLFALSNDACIAGDARQSERKRFNVLTLPQERERATKRPSIELICILKHRQCEYRMPSCSFKYARTFSVIQYYKQK